MALTPMMRQYFELKEQYSDCLLFFRLGDFYEMFFDDAKLVSKELELTLTGRDCGMEERAPMCGIPYHAVDRYLSRLVEKGYKVAICEQLEDPETAKGLVERGVIRIVTPGTVSEGSLLEEKENLYIMCVYEQDGYYGLAYADLSTGSFFVEPSASLGELQNVLVRVNPKEIVYPEENKDIKSLLSARCEGCCLTPFGEWAYALSTAQKTLLEHFQTINLSVFGIEEDSPCVNAAGALFQYLIETQKNSLSHIKKIVRVNSKKYMVIDQFTHRNLELTETMRAKSRKGSLLWLLDKTKTAMGGRLLKNYIEQPLLEKKAIQNRLKAVGELKDNYSMRSELRERLSGIYDIERLLSKISYASFDAKDALALKASILPIPDIKRLLAQSNSALLGEYAYELDELKELGEFLEQAIADTVPNGIRDGGIIKEGFNEEVDKLRNAAQSGQQWLSDMEQQEREATGIKNLKIGFNKVFGYYIEVTKSYLNLVPYRYTRRQTLAGCERYITPELKELEDTILTASEKCAKLEYQLFLQIRTKLEEYIAILQRNSEILAALDVLQSFAQAAYDNGYIMPNMREDGVIDIKGGRHPVVEKTVRQEFVPNDAYLDTKNDKMLIITGPNMAGKSTFMRQTGLIVLMAQMGSFVPASSASISIVDRVFTRVGASDDLASGQSTFMVEMNELASILNSATSKSLLILDEIGRGTSTLDGLSIAWATIEYILNHKNLGAKTLFATHYHELTDLQGMIPGIQNYSVSVKELDKTILFLHRIKPGGTDRSFGIEVARIAGLPSELTDRAKQLLGVLQQHTNTRIGDLNTEELKQEKELETAKEREIASMVRALDINTLTPLEALSVLNEMKQRMN